MKRLLRILLKVLLFSMAMSAIGLAVGRIVKGDTTEEDDDFRLFAFWNGWGRAPSATPPQPLSPTAFRLG